MTFDLLFAQALGDAQRFGHREHVHLTWLAVRAHGVTGATDLISNGIRRADADKYHATVTRAWVELVGFHLAEEPDFPLFLLRNPALLDKRLLSRFYHPETLASPEAKRSWVAPDKAPLP